MNKYDSIINIEHFEPKHKRMSRHDRSAQFAPFAALTGFEDEIEDANIFDDKKIIFDNYDNLNNIINTLKKDDKVIITYLKNINGHNKYIEITDFIKKIDYIDKTILLKNKIKINIYDIKEIKKPNS